MESREPHRETPGPPQGSPALPSRGVVDFSTWRQLLAGVSRLEQHRLVQIRVESAEGVSRILAQGLRLIGLSLDLRGAAAQSLAISVGSGRAGEPHLCHVVQDPVRIVTVWDQEGRLRCLEIEERGGARTEVSLAR